MCQVSPDLMDLDSAEAALFARLMNEWSRHLASNIRNEAYYRGKVRPVAESKADPKELADLDVVMGWGGKAVDALAARSVLLGFKGDEGAVDELNSAIGGADMAELYEQTVTSELTDSCAFLTISQGLEGEPNVIVSARSALDAAAIWDERRKRIKAGLAVIDITEDAAGVRTPAWVIMYTDSATYSCRRMASGRWVTQKADNPLGRPLMEPMRYRPSLMRPFGKSRITPTIRSLIDRALCVGARTEVTATFYTWPLRYLLGVDKKTAEDLAKRKIEMYADKMMLVSTNKNGDVPQFGQLSQASMRPHIDHLEMLGKQFASEACLPLDEVGIVFDNPTSSEAMYAAQQRLIVEAEHVNRMNSAALRNVALMALAASRGTDLNAVRGVDIAANFADVLRPSAAARADFAIKVNSAVDGYAMTPQFWYDLGYDEVTTRSILRNLRYVEASKALASAVSTAEEQPKAETEEAEPEEGEE